MTVNSLPLFKSGNHCRTTSSKSPHNKLTLKKWIQLGRCLKVINRVWSQLKRILMVKSCNSSCRIIKTGRVKLVNPSVFIQDQNNNNSKQLLFLFSIIHRLSLHQLQRILSNIRQQRISTLPRRNHPINNLFKHKALNQSFTRINRWLMYNIRALLWHIRILSQPTSSKIVNRKLLKREMDLSSSTWTIQRQILKEIAIIDSRLTNLQKSF